MHIAPHINVHQNLRLLAQLDYSVEDMFFYCKVLFSVKFNQDSTAKSTIGFYWQYNFKAYLYWSRKINLEISQLYQFRLSTAFWFFCLFKIKKIIVFSNKGLHPESNGMVGNNFYDPDLDDSFRIGPKAGESKWWKGEPVRKFICLNHRWKFGFSSFHIFFKTNSKCSINCCFPLCEIKIDYF